MELKERIKELSQTMKNNGIKVLEVRNQEEDIKIELFPFEAKNTEMTTEQYDAILAPLMGLGYIKPDDESKSYVSIGDKVKKGDVLCVIEKMKVMNEILADGDCEILEICFEHGTVVEEKQLLFKVKRIDALDAK